MTEKQLANLKPFSSTNQPTNHNKNRPKQYLIPLLKRCLNKKISYQDPETQKIIQGRVKDALIWRLILNGTEGDTKAIQEVLDRIDGKVKSTVDHSIAVVYSEMKRIIIETKPMELDLGEETPNRIKEKVK